MIFDFIHLHFIYCKQTLIVIPNANVVFYLHWYSDSASVKQTVAHTTLINSNTANLAYALDFTRYLGFYGAREGAWKVAVVVTDHLDFGSSQSALNAANTARAAGIQIIPVVINTDGHVDQYTLMEMASDYMFYIADDFEKLDDVVSRIAGFACMSGSPPGVDSVPNPEYRFI